MKNLNSFLNPRRKENIKFVLSEAFLDDKGNPIEWELKQLSASEDMELQKEINSKSYADIMLCYVAKALVYPNMHDSELLDGLSKKAGRTILKATDALKEMISSSELAVLIDKYTAHNDLTQSFSDKVDEAKN